MFDELIFWIFFWVIVAILFYIDLYVTDHRRGTITVKASLLWSGLWILTALVFNVFIYFYLENGHQKALEFLTGYLIEKSLSVDNLFVFLLIFRVMNVPPESQPHVLKWGIISAIIFRIIFIIAGVGLINLFHPIIYLFALILLYAAYKMAFGGEHKIDVDNNPFVRFAVRHFKLKPGYHGRHFFIKIDNSTYITTLFLTLLLIESSDIVFAVDSIPAIIAITQDEFIIISSNIFAILGLRALYFALAGVVDLFVYLKYGVAFVLFYVGIKMLISDIIEIPTIFSLTVILVSLGSSVIISLLKKKSFSEDPPNE
ncbi:MAG: TerC/Alx family metal homeostasis membrane protein [Ignavibacteriales bacterium]|nr:MAG: TerC/Alx family metal homeostasis membrane protein [Ignavibacteriales bacterium]